MKYMKKSKGVFALLSAMVLWTCGGKEESTPRQVQPKEHITTVQLDFINESDPTEMHRVRYYDPDGPGGQAPVFDPVALKPQSRYVCLLSFFDESRTPAYDVTNAIALEAESYQVFYEVMPGNGLRFAGYEDEDNQGRPLGLEAAFATYSPATDTLLLRLMYQPGGLKRGDSTLGALNFEACFPIQVAGLPAVQ
ncbi:hypothetical protein [Thermonema sp.]|uniref:hypothetical protein n=1 Tax=Thermonema sp. TaxID=2231181 RepID=UPI00258F48B0|nr:hypothetical protein [Thermonema sp.]